MLVVAPEPRLDQEGGKAVGMQEDAVLAAMVWLARAHGRGRWQGIAPGWLRGLKMHTLQWCFACTNSCWLSKGLMDTNWPQPLLLLFSSLLLPLMLQIWMGEGRLSSWTSHLIRLISCEQLMGMQCADFLLLLGGNWICPNGPDQGLRTTSCQLKPSITCSDLLISTTLCTLSHWGQLCPACCTLEARIVPALLSPSVQAVPYL